MEERACWHNDKGKGKFHSTSRKMLIKKLPVSAARKAGGGERVLSRLVERRMRHAMRGRSAVCPKRKQRRVLERSCLGGQSTEVRS